MTQEKLDILRKEILQKVSEFGKIKYQNPTFNPEETMKDVTKEIPPIKEIHQIKEIQTTIQEKYSNTLKKIEDEQIKRDEEQKISDEKYLKDIASKIHVLINDERTSRGLSSLSWNPTITKASINHSNDMAKRGYF